MGLPIMSFPKAFSECLEWLKTSYCTKDVSVEGDEISCDYAGFPLKLTFSKPTPKTENEYYVSWEAKVKFGNLPPKTFSMERYQNPEDAIAYVRACHASESSFLARNLDVLSHAKACNADSLPFDIQIDAAKKELRFKGLSDEEMKAIVSAVCIENIRSLTSPKCACRCLSDGSV